MWRKLIEAVQPTSKGVTENVIANLIVGGLALIGAGLLTWLAAPSTDREIVGWFLYALLVLSIAWAAAGFGWGFFWRPNPTLGLSAPEPELGTTPNAPVANALATDSLCRLAHLERWKADYSKHLDKAFKLQVEVEELFCNQDLSPDAPALWEKWQRLQYEWSSSLRGVSYAYQQSFGVDKDLSLAMKWHVGQTPIEGEDKMDPSVLAAKRHYYDQKDRFLQKLPGMNRRFATSIQEANETIWAHGRALLLKDLQ